MTKTAGTLRLLVSSRRRVWEFPLVDQSDPPELPLRLGEKLLLAFDYAALQLLHTLILATITVVGVTAAVTLVAVLA